MTAPSPPPAVTPTSETDVVLHNIVAALRRRAVTAIVILVALPAGAMAYSLRATTQYTATAKLLFRDPHFDETLFGDQVDVPPSDPARDAATDVGLLSVHAVAQRAARAITRGRLTAAQVRRHVTVAADGQSNLVSISATEPEPALAVELANAVGAGYIGFRIDADRAKIGSTITLVERLIRALDESRRTASEAVALDHRLVQLQTLSALQTGNAELVQRAQTATAQTWASTVRNTIVALLVALVLSTIAVLARERLDNRLHDGDQAQALLGRPLLASIAESRALRATGDGGLRLRGADAQRFRALLANVRYYNVDRRIDSLLVTSAQAGEGKSTVARHLAATAAASGMRVVLLEADLRHATLRPLYAALAARGLSDVLTGQATVAEAIQRLPVAAAGMPGPTTLDVLVSGSQAPNPADLLESERMGAVLGELRARYELVVVDSSPLGVVSDSVPLLGRVSGVLVVVRESRTTTLHAVRLRGQLARLGVVALGVVNNGARVGVDPYYAYYYATPPVDDAPNDGDATGSPRRRLPRRRGSRYGSQSPAIDADTRALVDDRSSRPSGR